MESNTSAALRNHALIKGLIEQGCEVELLTVGANRENPFFDETMQGEERLIWNVLPGVSLYQSMVRQEVSFAGKLKRMLLPLARKLYHTFNLFDHSRVTAERLQRAVLKRDRYDLVISSSDPKTSHLAVHSLRRQGVVFGTWIQYWGDPLTLDITAKHAFPRAYVRRVEERILRGADHVVYVSPFTLAAQQTLFPQLASRMHVLPVPYGREKRYGSTTLYDVLGKRRPLKIGYFGDYKSHVRNVLPLYEACREQSDLFLYVAGNTDLQLASNDSVQIMPRISQQEMERLEAECDVLVCLLNSSGTQIPGKVYHYTATDKPILIVLDGEHAPAMAQYFDRFERYTCCPNEPDAIRTALTETAQQLSDGRTFEPALHFAARTIAAEFLRLAAEGRPPTTSI